MNEHPYQPVEDAFRDGKINEQGYENLSSFLIALSNEVIPNENVRHRDIIRGLTINHILLQCHIDSLNKQNSKTQRWFMVFAVISAIGAVAPYLMPPATTPIQVVKAKPPHIQQPSLPTQPKPQASDQAIKKLP